MTPGRAGDVRGAHVLLGADGSAGEPAASHGLAHVGAEVGAAGCAGS